MLRDRRVRPSIARRRSTAFRLSFGLVQGPLSLAHAVVMAKPKKTIYLDSSESADQLLQRLVMEDLSQTVMLFQRGVVPL